MISLPEAFLVQMEHLLGKEEPAFREALSQPAPVSARSNPLKNFNWPENFEKVKWYANGVYLEKRPVFTLDPLFHSGAYYVQEASSMFVAEVVRQTVEVEARLRVLDLCAAPGGKSTLLAAVLTTESFLLANEVIRSRYQVLRQNLSRWGTPNAHSSNHDSRDFEGIAPFFDLILVDAPCSGEGLFRKDPDARQEWSPDHVHLCAGRQKRILADAVPLLKPGGVLIYCTCTFNDRENAENAEWLTRSFGLENLALNLDPAWGIVERKPGYQFFPHLAKGEGFYLATFRKPGEIPKDGISPTREKALPGWNPLDKRLTPRITSWLDAPERFSFFQNAKGAVSALLNSQVSEILFLSRTLKRSDWGLEVGTIKNDDFIPSPFLALSTAIHPDIPAVELSRQEALRFLKKEAFALEGLPKGWVLVRFEGHNLGWIKVLHNRINNYYPKEWRILMNVETSG